MQTRTNGAGVRCFLKVTVGRISTYGVLPLSTTLDTPGPLTRSMEETALLYHVLNGPDPRDYLTALAECEAHRHAFAVATADVDAVLTSTTQTPALPLDHIAAGSRPNHFCRLGNYLCDAV